MSTDRSDRWAALPETRGETALRIARALPVGEQRDAACCAASQVIGAEAGAVREYARTHGIALGLERERGETRADHQSASTGYRLEQMLLAREAMVVDGLWPYV
jgi:hypothetical protein